MDLELPALYSLLIKGRTGRALKMPQCLSRWHVHRPPARLSAMTCETAREKATALNQMKSVPTYLAAPADSDWIIEN